MPEQSTTITPAGYKLAVEGGYERETWTDIKGGDRIEVKNPSDPETPALIGTVVEADGRGHVALKDVRVFGVPFSYDSANLDGHLNEGRDVKIILAEPEGDQNHHIATMEGGQS